MENCKRIIIIDDDSIVITICQFLIKKIMPEVEVQSFTSPIAGLEFIQRSYAEHPIKTMLLLDINMPGLTGWEVLDNLKKFKDDIADQISIYMFSSSISMEDRKQSKAHPLVIDFISKPLTAEKLQEISNPATTLTTTLNS